MAIQVIVSQENNVINTTISRLIESKISVQNAERPVEQDIAHNTYIQEKIVINTIEKANKRLEGIKSELEFSIHEKTKQIMVKVIDKETNEIVREIPSEKVLDMVAAMCEGAGLFVDEKL